MTNHVTCERKEALIGYLYEDGDAGERAGFEAHLAQCAACRAELEALRSLRTGLGAWTPPERDLGFTIVRRAEPMTTRRLWTMPAWGWAAAAVLLLAASAALANLDVRYGPDGLTVRTSLFASASDAASAGPVGPSAGVVSEVRDSSEGSGPWRAELAALENRLRSEFSASRPAAVAELARSRPARAADDGSELLRRVQALIAESEGRQQRELALRVAQVVRDFDRQRQTDLVSIQRGLGQIEGSAAENREVLNYLVRVSQQR